MLRFPLSPPASHPCACAPLAYPLTWEEHVSSFTLNKFTSLVGSTADEEAELRAALLFVGWHTLQMVVAGGPDFIYMHI